MANIPRCGTGDTGCNGVFAPVCAPEICNVPRIPHHETLVTGEGVLLDMTSGQNISFSLLIERTMQVYQGHLYMQGSTFYIHIDKSTLKLFESDGHLHMSALFYEESTQRNIFVTLHQDHHSHTSHLFIDSTSTMAELIHIEGHLISGSTNIYTDHNVHEH